MVGALTKLKSYLDYGTFQPIQIASIVALNEAADYPKTVNAIYESRRDSLVDGLNRIGWTVCQAGRHHVRLGASARAVPGNGLARVRQVPGDRRGRGDLTRGWFRDWWGGLTSASRSSRTSSASPRPSATSGGL